MRFAVLEMKLCLTKILQKYNIYPTPSTPKQLQFIEGTVRRPVNKIPIILKKRISNF
jgi:hypothetical protein